MADVQSIEFTTNLFGWIDAFLSLNNERFFTTKKSAVNSSVNSAVSVNSIQKKKSVKLIKK